jgi:hypothetical protein
VPAPRSASAAPGPAGTKATPPPAQPAPPRTLTAEEPAEAPTRAEPPNAPAVDAPPAEPEAPITFNDVKMLVVDGSKSREASGRLTFREGKVTFLPEKGHDRSFPYRSLVSATYSQSKHPRWKEGLGVAVAVGVFSAPIFFMKSTRHWLTLQSGDDFMVLRLDKNNVNLVLPALESRTGLKVERVKDDK